MSQVPKLEIRGAIKVGKAIVEGQQEDAIEEEVSHLDEDFDFSVLKSVIKKIKKDLQAGGDAQLLELKYSGAVYLSLKDLKTELRANTDVWRGITAKYFIDQVMARVSNHEKSKWQILGTGSNPREILAWRMFTRGQLCHEDGDSFPYIEDTGKESHDF